MAPTIYLEQLEYDVRLFNESIKEGRSSALQLQNLLVKSDMFHDPQAFILSPENVITISAEMIKGNNYIEAAVLGALKGLELIEKAVTDKLLKLEAREHKWLNMMREEINSIPLDEEKFIEEMLPLIDNSKIILSEYGL
jgi:methanol--5-hydroxybenzimidazolylcobamide Co-methyltransferase